MEGVKTEDGVVFQSQQGITLAEAATVLNRILKVSDIDPALIYSQQSDLSGWATQAVANMASVSVISTAGGLSQQNLDQAITRAEAAQMLSAAGTLLEGEPAGLFDWLL